MGADGSGKSTVIDGVTEYLDSEGITVNYQHWRPVIGDKKENSAPVSDPHSRPARGVVASWLRVVALTTVWWRSYFKHLVKLRKKGTLIIFDRFYADLLVDPRRYRYGGGKSFAAFFFHFMPKPDLVILLDAEAEVLFARKPEVALEPLREIVSGYRKYINDANNGVLINSDQTVNQVMSDVLKEVNRLIGLSKDNG